MPGAGSPGPRALKLDDVAIMAVTGVLAGCGLVYEYLLAHAAGRILGAVEAVIFTMIGVMIVAIGILVAGIRAEFGLEIVDQPVALAVEGNVDVRGFAGQKKGEGNRKNGNRYLAWAFMESAHFAIRYNDRIKSYYQRKKAKTKRIIALKAVAHKLARACYFILRDGVPFDVERSFA